MKTFKSYFYVLLVLIIGSAVYSTVVGNGMVAIENTNSFHEKLSSYAIYKGNPSDLTPSEDYFVYELSAPLFTDYAEKQRLIKLPKGKQMTKIDDGLPAFPDGTIIAKTFYYFHDEREPAMGKQIIETRLLQKVAGVWNVAVYLWNQEQTDAELIETGHETAIRWNDQRGKERHINYRVPNLTDCTTCHQSDEKVLPIGPKLRMLNKNVAFGDTTVNQLVYMQHKALLNAFDPASVGEIPHYFDSKYDLDKRARAYLESNCAHCHNKGGAATNFAFWLDLNLDIKTPFDSTNISGMKDKILLEMQTKEMPFIGTTVVDEEGVKLIKEYVESL